jgi:transposase
MFLKRNRRKAKGQTYEYWNLVQTVRTPKGPRHQVVACLGKVSGLDKGCRRGWEDIIDLLEGNDPQIRPRQLRFGQAESELPTRPQWAQVDVTGMSVERLRDFGQVYLALALWRRLGVHKILEELIEPGGEHVAWDQVACILTIARFCDNKSELEAAERWYHDCALEDLLGVPWEKVNDTRLYRGLDILHEHKDALCSHLIERYRDMFGVDFEFLLYDVTSTYFEGKAEGNTKAQRGYSRDKRPDCKQVNIGLVVTPEGLPIGYEIFSGNTADVTTVEDMVQMMEEKYGQAQRVWVMDRGMVSEDNLEFLRERKASYIVGTPKAQLKKFEQQLTEKNNWVEVHEGLEVKLVEHPDGNGTEQYIMCRSAERREKENSMLELKRQRLLEKLKTIDTSLRKKPITIEKAERRVGRWLGKFPTAERLFEVEVTKSPCNSKAIGLAITEREINQQWAELSQGAYLLRTNCQEKDPAKIWKWYIQLTKAEEAFRISKSDLHLRPVYHQKTDRVEAHILVCFLTLAMWRSLEMWMKSKGLGDCCRQLIKEVSTIRSLDVVLPVKDGTQLRLRTVAKPDKPVTELLAHLGLELPTAPKLIQNVVPKIA